MPQPNAAVGLVCGEVRGGNEPVWTVVDLPGSAGVLYSSPCHGAQGGDVHYCSMCNSGIIARVCLADVAGHGEKVAGVARVMHQELRESVNSWDEREVMSKLDTRLEQSGLKAITTAALVSYRPWKRRLTVSYAGHPPGWIYRRPRRRRRGPGRQRPLDAPHHRRARAGRPGRSRLWARASAPPTRARRSARRSAIASSSSPTACSRPRRRMRPSSATPASSACWRAASPTAAAATASARRSSKRCATTPAAIRWSTTTSASTSPRSSPPPPGPQVWQIVKNRLLAPVFK